MTSEPPINRHAIVTGASGGLGRALCLALCRRGVRVTGFARRQAALDETTALAGSLFTGMAVDVADDDAVAAAFDRLDATGAPDILVNNAAVYPRRDILDETAQSFSASVAINLGGTVNCTIAVLARMALTGRGRILNVATFADVAPLPASAAYAVSKGAQRIFSRALVADLGDRFPGIIISDWMPGMLATGMGIADGLAPEAAAEWGAQLAVWDDASLNGTIWEMNRELLPARGLKRRLKDRLLRRKPVARQL